MKEMNMIDNIICNVMTDGEFDHLQEAEFDRWDLDARVARNGLRRLSYGLGKFGLTVAEWDAWHANEDL
jgi:hypothetical protein